MGVDHQHWFNLRLDFDVDGRDNAVAENNVRRLSGPQTGATASQGPYFTSERRVLPRAVDARRDADDETSRTWTVFNPASRGKTGRPTGYEVVPQGNTATVYPLSREKGPAAFTFHHLWVTPYREGQLFADGRYPNQPSPGYADTLYHYANADSIYGRDIVVWYSLGETHVPRVEDYPLMNDATLSVLFRPDGFFESNPALGAVAGP
jgi:primary-amine oxidase